MADWAWTLGKAALLVFGFGIAAAIFDWVRNTFSARTGIGRFYNRLPKPASPARLLKNIELLGNHLQNRATSKNAFVAPGDWEFRLGNDLKEIVDLVRAYAPEDRDDMWEH